MICLIPARGGSKGILRKNLALLQGRPLLEYSIRAAQSSKLVTQVMVSTEDAEIEQVARALGASVLMRPAELAEDHTTVLDVLLHATRFEAGADIICLLQPVNPFVTWKHIDGCLVTLSNEMQWESVQTVTPVPHNHHLINQRMIQKAGSTDFWFPDMKREHPQKQSKPPALSYGGCVALRVDAARHQDTCFPQPSQPILIDPPYSHDIDTPYELALAEAMLAAGLVKLPHMENIR